MIKAGFTNLPSEIWHYDYGNRAWAYYKKSPLSIVVYLNKKDETKNKNYIINKILH